MPHSKAENSKGYDFLRSYSRVSGGADIESVSWNECLEMGIRSNCGLKHFADWDWVKNS